MVVWRSCRIREGFGVEGYELGVVDEIELASAARAWRINVWVIFCTACAMRRVARPVLL